MSITDNGRRPRRWICRGSWRCAGSSCPRRCWSMLPSFGNLMVDLLKLTSLVSLITLTDLTFAGTALITTTGRPGQVWGLVLVLYFLMATPIGWLDPAARDRAGGTPARAELRRHEVRSQLCPGDPAGPAARGDRDGGGDLRWHGAGPCRRAGAGAGPAFARCRACRGSRPAMCSSCATRRCWCRSISCSTSCPSPGSCSGRSPPASSPLG